MSKPESDLTPFHELRNLVSMLGTAVKSALLPLIYRYPPSVLAPERLAVYLHTLLEKAAVPGAVGEVGCNLAGTSVIAATLLRRIGARKDYICFDTFSGFVSDQFEADVKLGTPRKDKSMFAANSAKLVRRILDYHDCPEVRLVEGDFTAIDQAELPSAFSVVLLDIDLSEPTYASLGRIWPRLSPGGVILVDDCPEATSWKAREGYVRFCREQSLPETYSYGLGVLERR